MEKLLYNPLRRFFKLLGRYLEASSNESLMRLLSFLAVMTGCAFITGIIFYVIYSLVNGQTIDLMGVAACVGSAATFVGTGIAGKAYQKKVEYSSFHYAENKNGQEFSYGDPNSEGIPEDEQ